MRDFLSLCKIGNWNNSHKTWDVVKLSIFSNFLNSKFKFEYLKTSAYDQWSYGLVTGRNYISSRALKHYKSGLKKRIDFICECNWVHGYIGIYPFHSTVTYLMWQMANYQPWCACFIPRVILLYEGASSAKELWPAKIIG